MIILEILMVIVGLGAVALSYRLTEGKRAAGEESRASSAEPLAEAPSVDWEEKLSQLRERVETLYEDVEDRMSRMSNEKIMGMSEYSEQVLDKIEKNHGEVVFLYDMMNGKQEEIQQLIREVDGIKADLHNEATGEFLKLKEQEKVLEDIRREIELDSLEYQSQKEEIREEWEALERRVMEDSLEEETGGTDGGERAQEKPVKEAQEAAESAVEDASDGEEATSIFDAEIARIEEEETRAMQEEREVSDTGYQPLSQQEKPVNHNDEIIQLYKKGRSILDISKMLALGQGEVKFVIDLYNAR